VKQVSDGLRLEKPKECPPILWDIILQCWQEDSSQRPTFSVLNKSIKAAIFGNPPEPSSPPTIQNDGKEVLYYNSKENYYQTQ
jgi:hypothetical protein